MLQEPNCPSMMSFSKSYGNWIAKIAPLPHKPPASVIP